MSERTIQECLRGEFGEEYVKDAANHIDRIIYDLETCRELQHEQIQERVKAESALASSQAREKTLTHELRIALNILEDIEAGDFGKISESQVGSIYMSIGSANRALSQEETKE